MESSECLKHFHYSFSNSYRKKIPNLIKKITVLKRLLIHKFNELHFTIQNKLICQIVILFLFCLNLKLISDILH